MKNPFSVSGKQTVQMRIHKDLAMVLNRERMKHQRISDVKFGKNKFKVKNTFASKVIGGLLK